MKTLPDIHRILYRRLRGKASQKSIDLLLTAFEMGKKMDNKLRQYQEKRTDDWWEENRLAGGEIEGRDDRPTQGFVVPPLDDLCKRGERLPSWWDV